MPMLKGEQLQAWTQKNQRLNQDRVLQLGDRLRDAWAREGVVVDIQWPKKPSIQNHGGITVQRDDGSIDHYVAFGWQTNFRLIS